MNYGNRNASTPYTTSDLANGYLAACAVSIGIAMGSRVLFANFLKRQQGQRQFIANAAIGYFSGAFAGVANLTCMRQREMQKGVVLMNKEGDQCYGQSPTAGRKAIFQTAMSRFILPLPVMFAPIALSSLFSMARLLPKNQALRNCMELSFCTIGLLFGLPMSVALYKQQSSILASELEPEFQNLKDPKTGEVIKEYYFNRGL